jgi:hypothetical protein
MNKKITNHNGDGDVSNAIDEDLARSILCLADAHTAAMGKLSDAVFSLANRVRDLGNGNAATQMGAIENLSCEINRGLGSVAEAFTELESATLGCGFFFA